VKKIQKRQTLRAKRQSLLAGTRKRNAVKPKTNRSLTSKADHPMGVLQGWPSIAGAKDDGMAEQSVRVSVSGHFTTMARQNDPDLLLRGMQLARRTPDILSNLLGRCLRRHGFLNHLQLQLG
jgi:hypothetical protein